MSVDDILDYNLSILFCGINPGLYSAKIGHHFARPGNKFWKGLYLSGLTDRLYQASEDKEILSFGLGIINFVNRPSASAGELTVDEFKKGKILLKQKIKKWQPKVVAFLGIGAYKIAFGKKVIKIGFQDETIGKSKVWVLPNPSRLNAHFSVEDFGKLFRELKSQVSQS